jgi:hypothetical protein
MTFSTLLRSTLPPIARNPRFCRHADQCRLWVAHGAAIGIDPATVDDGDALVPIGCRSSIGTDARPGLRAGQAFSAQPQERLPSGTNLRASGVRMPAL